jgi:hypothetical protein
MIFTLAMFLMLAFLGLEGGLKDVKSYLVLQ